MKSYNEHVLENRVQLLGKKVEELESENRRLVLDNYHLSLDLGYTTRKLNSLLSLSNKPMGL